MIIVLVCFSQLESTYNYALSLDFFLFQYTVYPALIFYLYFSCGKRILPAARASIILHSSHAACNRSTDPFLYTSSCLLLRHHHSWADSTSVIKTLRRIANNNSNCPDQGTGAHSNSIIYIM